MTEPTDAEIIALADETRTAEGGANGYILPISFARAVLAKWGAPAQAAPAYKDSTPELHVGDSTFENWYITYNPAHKADKQRARDAYAAGMGDPLVTAAPAAVGVEPIGYLYCGGSYGGELEDWEIVANQHQCDKLNEYHGSLGKEAKLPIYTTPPAQADSQPAMTPETVYAAIAHGDEEHRAWLLSALRAVWCGEAVPPVASPIANAPADSQPVLPEITAEDRSFLHYNPNTDDIVEWVQHYASAAITADRAARAPADSVTAPATESYVQPVPDKCDRIVWRGHYYHLPPAQAADSVLEDAARLEFEMQHGSAIAAARKQGVNND